MHFIGNNGSQNTFVYQPTLYTLQFFLKKDQIMFLVRYQKEYVNSKLASLNTAFLYTTKLSEHRMWINFCKNNFAVEQNNYTTKIANVYVAYDFDAWP